MKQNLDFEPEIIEAIQAGQKIKAIKLLRESKGFDLIEAKALVDLYCQENNIAPAAGGSSGRLFIMIILVGLIYLVYHLFSN